MMKSAICGLALAVGLVVCGGVARTASAGTIPVGWSCTGTCGTDGADGVVPLSPYGSSAYDYVSTTGGPIGGGTIPGGSGVLDSTNGSTLTTSVFAATAGETLQYYFDYVTSDGSGFPDYSWAELETSTGTPVALLFTAETQPSGTISPGVDLPTPAATLTPSAVPIIPDETTWSPLGEWSGQCWAAGCGTTGWIQSDYTIGTGGSYELAFGVSNTNDGAYDSGLAIDGVTVGGVPINPPVGTPEPGTILLLGIGLVSLTILARRREVL